ncbi:uncharacterized protein LOC142339160 isoform X3 [Convolutriloba macropyga]|uniref:uncharacterized protein LOC142339160 isoform X3 n=1 Tax=Convolutriloba macropyga TaxID=536237 RepID=UPI003F52822E
MVKGANIVWPHWDLEINNLPIVAKWLNQSHSKQSSGHFVFYFPLDHDPTSYNHLGKNNPNLAPEFLSEIQFQTPMDFNTSSNTSGPQMGHPMVPPWTTFKVLIEIICFIFGIVGILGNSLVVTVYIRKAHRKATEILILCLSCLDLVYCVCNNVIQVLIIVMESHPPTHFVEITIDLVLNYLFTSLPYMSWLMILNITCNRYIAVCHPFRYSQLYTLAFARNAVLAILVVSIVIGVPTLGKAWMSPTGVKTLLKVYQGMRAALVAIVCSAMFLMYSRVINKLRNQNKNSMLYKSTIAEEETYVYQPVKTSIETTQLSPALPSATHKPPLEQKRSDQSPGANHTKREEISRMNGSVGDAGAERQSPRLKTRNQKRSSKDDAAKNIEERKHTTTTIKVEFHHSNLSINEAAAVNCDTKHKQSKFRKNNEATNKTSGLLSANQNRPHDIPTTSINGYHHESDDEAAIEVEHQDDGTSCGPSQSNPKNPTTQHDFKLAPRTYLGDELGHHKTSRLSGIKLSASPKKSAAMTQAKINSEKRARKTTVTLWIVCCVFLGLNMPNAVTRLVRGYTNIDVNDKFYEITLVMYTISFAVNPFIYYFTNSSFKKDVQNLLPFCSGSNSVHD